MMASFVEWGSMLLAYFGMPAGLHHPWHNVPESVLTHNAPTCCCVCHGRRPASIGGRSSGIVGHLLFTTLSKSCPGAEWHHLTHCGVVLSCLSVRFGYDKEGISSSANWDNGGQDSLLVACLLVCSTLGDDLLTSFVGWGNMSLNCTGALTCLLFASCGFRSGLGNLACTPWHAWFGSSLLACLPQGWL